MEKASCETARSSTPVSLSSDKKPTTKPKTWHLSEAKQKREESYPRKKAPHLFTSEQLNNDLAGIDKQAEDIFSRPVKPIAECDDVTKQSEASSPIE